MKKYIIAGFALLSMCAAKAQQLQTTSLYDMQGLLNNPSLAGVSLDENFKGMAGASFRQQWSGISGAPQTLNVFGSFALPQHKIGVGGYVYSDKTGPTSRTGVSLSFAKHIRFRNNGLLSLGIEARMQQFAIDQNKLKESLGNDPVLGSADNRFKFDAGFGLSYTHKNFQVGAAVSQLVQSKLDFYSGNLATTEIARLYRHYYFHGKYNWHVDGYTTISPNVLVVYLPNAPTEVTTNVRVEHNKLFWWGLGYRFEQGWLLSAGLHLKKKFSLGFSYDIYTNPVSNFSGGHNAVEFLLRYNFLK
jgi:type IX secretion system PorP/SprF family membrane protein